MVFVAPLLFTLFVACEDEVEELFSVALVFGSLLSPWKLRLLFAAVAIWSSSNCFSAIKSLRYSTVFSSHIPPEEKIRVKNGDHSISKCIHYELFDFVRNISLPATDPPWQWGESCDKFPPPGCNIDGNEENELCLAIFNYTATIIDAWTLFYSKLINYCYPFTVEY